MAQNDFRYTIPQNSYLKQDVPNDIFAGCLMWPHLFPLYVSQIFKTIPGRDEGVLFLVIYAPIIDFVEDNQNNRSLLGESRV